MKKNIVVIAAVLVSLTVVGCGPKNLQEALAKRKALTSYQMTFRTSAGQTMTQFLQLAEGKPVKTKTFTPRGWVIMHMADKVMYMGSSARPAVMKMAIDEQQSQKQQGPQAPDVESYDKQAPVVSKETIDGVTCYRFDVTEEDGSKGSVWIGDQYALIRKAERGGETINFSYDQINAVPDSEFEVPKDAKIMDMTKLQQGLGKLGNFMKGLGGGQR